MEPSYDDSGEFRRINIPTGTRPISASPLDHLQGLVDETSRISRADLRHVGQCDPSLYGLHYASDSSVD